MNVGTVDLSLLVTIGALVAAFVVYQALTIVAAARWRRHGCSIDPDWTPGVTILKPVRGVDAEARENFASFCRQDYPSEKLQIIFGILDSDDPAVALIDELRAAYPEISIEIVCGGENARRGHNLKVCNLLAMLPRARHELLILCDSDMRARPDYLREVVAPFQPEAKLQPHNVNKGKRGVGLVTCPYRGHRTGSLPAALEAIGIGADFVPSAMLSRMLEGVTFAFGSTIVLRKETLDQLGGLEPLLDELADDYRLGNGVARLGYEVVLSRYVIEDVLGNERFLPMWDRRLRWARTVRSCRPGGYACSVVTHGFALSLLFLALTDFRLAGFLTAGGVLLFRMLSALWIARLTEDPNVPRNLHLLPLSDLLSFGLFLCSFGSNRLIWRGERFRLLPGGKLIREELSS